MNKTIAIIGICLLLGLNGLHAQINVKKGEGGLWILDGKNKVAFYQKEEVSMNLECGRANFLHPVYLPDGTIITENAPADHVHHRGIFWAWHQILIDGKSMGDSWALKDVGVDVKSVEFKRISQEKGQLETISFWESPAWKNGEEAFLEEITTYTFFQQSGNYRKIKIDVRLKSLVDKLQIGGSDDEKGYGGFSIRMKLPDDIRFISETGPVEPVVTAVEAGQYMNMTGAVGKNGTTGGIIIYADPRNQSAPQSWILRNEKSMQNAVFPGRNPVELKKEVPMKLSYTLILYSGKINLNRVIKKIATMD